MSKPIDSKLKIQNSKLKKYCVLCGQKLTAEPDGPLVFLACKDCNLIIDYYPKTKL